jgi:hypothetical protein
MAPIRITAISAAIIGLLAVIPFGAVAQDVQEPEQATAVEFTATFPWGPELDSGTEMMRPDGITELVGWAHQSTTTDATDPRFDGEMIYTCNSHEYPIAQGTVWDYIFRIENDGGAWQNRPVYELTLPDGSFSTFTAAFDGEEGYKGQTAIVEITEVAGRGYTLHGLIVDGDLPPTTSSQP